MLGHGLGSIWDMSMNFTKRVGKRFGKKTYFMGRLWDTFGTILGHILGPFWHKLVPFLGFPNIVRNVFYWKVPNMIATPLAKFDHFAALHLCITVAAM